MPKVKQNHKTDDIPVATVKPLPAEEDIQMPELSDVQEKEIHDSHNPDWTKRREIYVLPNGATLVARNEIEAAAYANKGGTLVDEVYDE